MSTTKQDGEGEDTGWVDIEDLESPVIESKKPKPPRPQRVRKQRRHKT